ncbi:unannotated protein [freshwater metagenome]|uniref:Unannotated protein n=1 Tax=freshwater metagenome TaxID=449393 RepID=A0A6J7EDB9_9ZZZZ
MFVVDHIPGHGCGVMRPPGLVFEGLLGQHIGHAVQRCRLAEGQLQRHDAGSEATAQLLDHTGKVGALFVLFVHEDHAWQPERCGAAPQQRRLHLDAIDRADHEHRQISHAEGSIDLSHEVGIAGRVQQVDLVDTLIGGRPLERGERERQRDAPFDGLRFGVQQTRAVIDLAGPRHASGPGQQRLGQGGLADTTVADQHHVANSLRRVAHLHRTPILFGHCCSGTPARVCVRISGDPPCSGRYCQCAPVPIGTKSPGPAALVPCSLRQGAYWVMPPPTPQVSGR